MPLEIYYSIVDGSLPERLLIILYSAVAKPGAALKSPQLLPRNGTPAMLYNAIAKPSGELKSPQLLLRSYTGARPELGHRPHGLRHVCKFPQAGNHRTSSIFFIRLINVKNDMLPPTKQTHLLLRCRMVSCRTAASRMEIRQG